MEEIMQVETDRMIPVARLQKELTGKLRELTDQGEPLYVMRNNTLAAVIVSPDEYDLLKNAGELVEHLEIAEMIGLRLKGHKRARNIPWEKVKKDHGL
jgi:PHD/YefM family antitoxin component YafN of YafNO toxin-antitoxin module